MKPKITAKARFDGIIGWFSANMPVAESELHFENAFHLLIAVILSAQCTDKRVNMITPPLFEKYPTPQSLADASVEEVFEMIKSVSYPNNKAKHLVGMAQRLVSIYNSKVPSDVEDLKTLPGVGQKTANVVASVMYDKPVIAVDTHVFRISNRLGLSKGNTPEKVEADLEKNIPLELRAKSHHWLILHGRYVCTARKPNCSGCGLAPWCSSYPLG